MKRVYKVALGCWLVLCPIAIILGAWGWASTPSQREVTFSSTGPDPPILAATVYSPYTPGPHPGVVVFHGVGGSRQDTAGIGIALARAGMTALCVDSRGHGTSGGYIEVFNSDTWNLTFYDAFGALDFLAGLEDIDPARLGVQGFSLGGAQATLLALQDSRLKAVVAWAPANWVRRFGTPVRDLPAPPSSWAVRVLILQGTVDPISPLEDAQALAARWSAVTLELLYDVNHYIMGPVWVNCVDRTVEYLTQSLGGSLSPYLPEIWLLNAKGPTLTYIGGVGLGLTLLWATIRYRRGQKEVKITP